MSYEKPWGRLHPGCLIILLDQSGSMDQTFGGNQLGKGKKKKDMVATVLNSLLYEFAKSNTVGTEVRGRADIAVLGYEGSNVRSALGGGLASKDFVSLPELYSNPIRIEARETKEMDETGKVITMAVHFPIWVEPLAGGGTPMCAALARARQLAEQWVATHPDNYPPVVINVSDGGSTDGDIAGPAQALRQVRTSDGEVLLFNCHITNLNDPEVAFVGSESDVPNDGHAKLLFGVSSPIPDTARKLIEANGQALAPGARGFIFNGDANAVRQMFVFATIQAQQGIDTNM